MIVDQALAAKAFPNGAVGQRILTRINTPTNVWYEVVGVVAHQRLSSLAETGREQMYVTNGALGYGWLQGWAVRARGDPARYAAPGGIFGLMIAYGLRLSAAGIAAGLIAALLLTQAMTSMLVGIKATDPVTFAAMAVLFFLIAALATWVPARRAAALDPSAALREE
jgi:hypothetical protein